MKLPALRPLDAFPLREDGQVWLALRDVDGWTDRLTLLTHLEAQTAARFDGRRTAAQVAAELARHGLATDAAEVAAFAERLDRALLLDSPRFRKLVKARTAAYRKARARPAHLAGRSYAADPRELAAEMAAFFARPGAPGAAPARGSRRRPTGLVAPHIDFHRGGAGYAWAYRELLGSSLPPLCVVIGVAHRTPGTPLVLAAKDFETPLGPVPLAEDLARALEDGAPYDLRADELVHRAEHSAEFQAVWLAYARQVLGGETRMLPLLASSCDLDGSDPGARTEAVLDRLIELLEPLKSEVVLVCGADLAHIGPRFGDDRDVTPAWLAEVEARDREGLTRLAAQDAEGWLESVQRDGNARKVCGVSAAYAFSRLHRALYPAAKGELLHWGHAADPAGGEVSFASMAFA
ncbi:AmmeMemoRadiSam system protein B [bacterium]|nr:MAG: AmmeMemoRadiSam system protein B [bacterium]